MATVTTVRLRPSKREALRLNAYPAVSRPENCPDLPTPKRERTRQGPDPPYRGWVKF
jgi:hypothetical protein